MNALSPRAFDAIVGQIECKADVRDTSRAVVDGDEWEFHTLFCADWDWFSDHPGQPIYWEATCDLVGAWALDPETDHYRFAGNRAEVVALVGEETVRRWERDASETASENAE